MSSIKNHWSFFPPTDGNGKLTIKVGKEAIKDIFIHYLLMRKGEHPLFYNLGLPDYLFKVFSDVNPIAFAEIIKEQLQQINVMYKLGVEKFTVIPSEAVSNEAGNFALDIYLEFAKPDRFSTNFILDYKTLTRQLESNA